MVLVSPGGSGYHITIRVTYLIWVDTSGNTDTSGNIYLGRKNRTLDYI